MEIASLIDKRPYLAFIKEYKSWHAIAIPPFQHQYLHVFTDWTEFSDCGKKMNLDDEDDMVKNGDKVYYGMAWFGSTQAKKEKFETFKCLIFINLKGYGRSKALIEATIDHELHHIVSNVLKHYGFDLNDHNAEELGAHLGDWLKWRIMVEIFNRKDII